MKPPYAVTDFQGDGRALKWGIRDLESLRAVVKMVPRHGTCVQAGGNLGVFAKYLAQYFSAVYVFEPSQELFPVMVTNAPEPNVIRFQAALGDTPRLVGTACNRRKHGPGPIHPGLTHIDGDGIIPVLRLDDFRLPSLDLLYLDLEGYELFALIGAAITIDFCRPVIAVEINSNITYYGQTADDVRRWFAEHDYRRVTVLHSDEVFLPGELAAQWAS